MEPSPARVHMGLLAADHRRHEDPPPKRRRISVEEVEDHLRAANLSQPALSLLYAPRNGESDVLREASGKRECIEPHKAEHTKRRRLYVHALAPSVARNTLPS